MKREIPWHRLSAFRQYRALEMVPGVLVWSTFVMVILLTILRPLWAINFIIVFDLFWLVRILYVLTFTVLAYVRFRRSSRIDWLARCQTPELRDRFRQLYHVIIIPTYQDELRVLESTFTALARVQYPLDRFIVVLACEARDAERARGIARAIQEKFGSAFFRFLVTEHPASVPGELPGKGSNIAWAGRRVRELLDGLGIRAADVLVSSFDVDTCPHPAYFSCLAYTFLTHPRPYQTSFQPIPVFHNNIWDAPSLMRVVANSTTFWLLGETMRPERMFTFSSHSMSFQTLVAVDFWQSDIVTEDSRIFIQCFLHFDGDYVVTPIYVSVSMDTVLGKTWWQSLRNQYRQIRRWAYGVENFPFMVWNFGVNRLIPLGKKFRYIWTQLEGTYSWATAPIIIFALGHLSLALADPRTRASAVYSNAPDMLRWIMVIAMVGLLATAIMNTLMLPDPPQKRRTAVRYLFMLLQWFLLPVTMIVFGSVPAIDAQTRLMLGRYLGFQATEKWRRPSESFAPRKSG